MVGDILAEIGETGEDALGVVDSREYGELRRQLESDGCLIVAQAFGERLLLQGYGAGIGTRRGTYDRTAAARKVILDCAHGTAAIVVEVVSIVALQNKEKPVSADFLALATPHIKHKCRVIALDAVGLGVAVKTPRLSALGTHVHGGDVLAVVADAVSDVEGKAEEGIALDATVHVAVNAPRHGTTHLAGVVGGF